MYQNKQAFTLIEVLVVVLIIGILGAIALPQYQKAVLKSRFAALMPIAKSMADSNEVYYLEHGEYASNPQELTVTGQENYPDGTSVLLYPGTDDLSFVRVNNTGVPNAQYVVYQKHSANFPDTTWCEAGDERAEEICVALGGQEQTGLTGNSSGSDGWKAYLLSGTAREGDSFAGAGSGSSGGATSSTRVLSGDPSCNFNPKFAETNCSYTYTTGETLEESLRSDRSVSISCDQHDLCVFYTPTGGDGTFELKLRNGNDVDWVYYDKDGNVVGIMMNRPNVQVIYDSEGNIKNITREVRMNYYLTYDAEGNLRKVQNGGNVYYYDDNNPNTKITSAQMAELAGNTATTAQTYATYNKCQLFPESYGCSTNP